MPYEHCSPPSLAGPGWGCPWVSLYPPTLPVVLRGGGTHGSPIPLYVSLSVCGFSAGPPYTHQGDSCWGMPPRHDTWLRGSHLWGTSPLPYLAPYPKKHSCSGSSLSVHPTINPVGGGALKIIDMLKKKNGKASWPWTGTCRVCVHRQGTPRKNRDERCGKTNK